MSYAELLAELHTAGVYPYVVNEKIAATLGYRRMWKIFVPAGPGRAAETIWVEDDHAARDAALKRLILRHCPSVEPHAMARSDDDQGEFD